MNIEFGSIEYFELLSVQTFLKGYRYSKLGLANWDKLKFEVDFEIEKINHRQNERLKSKSSEPPKDLNESKK